MDAERFARISIISTVPRQTPKDDFGDRLSSGAAAAGGLITTLVPGTPLVSAAVSTTRAVAGITSVSTASPRAIGQAEPWQLLAAQDAQSKEFLALQNEMQRESREFNALSNVLKVRHDSAKAAINNIR